LKNFGCIKAFAACEDINGMSAQREVAAHFIDIDVLATSIGAS
jgi:hypothetical protein